LIGLDVHAETIAVPIAEPTARIRRLGDAPELRTWNPASVTVERHPAWRILEDTIRRAFGFAARD
jgi:hypothetical protein